MANPRASMASTKSCTGASKGDPLAYQRVVVKAGTTLLTRGAEGLDSEVMSSLVSQIADLHLRGVEMILVSSGAVAAGRHVIGSLEEGRGLPLRQALAAVGQGHIMHTYEQLFGGHGVRVAQALLSRRDLADRLGYLNVRNTLMALLELGVVPIVNENDVVAVEELSGEQFGDNDTLSALVANLVDADLLMLLGDIDGLYTSDPNVDPGARLVPTVEHVDEGLLAGAGPSWKNTGRGGMATKLEAARLATASGVDVVIANGALEEVIPRLARGDHGIGTRFPSSVTKMDSRRRWMLSGLSTCGEVIVDEGAATALRHHHRSLLPAGITGVSGSFERGDIIAIVGPSRDRIASGLTNYGSADLAKIRGARSDRISELLGHEFGDEAVHRNNMIVA